MLRCLRNYRGVFDHRLIVISQGEAVKDPSLVAFLLEQDSGAFELIEEPAIKMVEEAPADKMMRRKGGKA